MRLIQTTHYGLLEFVESKIPPYAILSHTWGDHEVTFQHYDPSVVENSNDYGKIKACCKIAREHGYEYVSVDTCCIDKSSSAELSESINSMYN